MPHAPKKTLTILMLLAAVLATTLLSGCSSGNNTGVSTNAGVELPSGSQSTASSASKYSQWVIYINDVQRVDLGGATYAIQANAVLNSTDPTPSGEYTGLANFLTTTYVAGKRKASSLSNSSDADVKITTVAGANPSLTRYNGSGSMTITPNDPKGKTVGGPFAAASDQKFTMAGSGDKITMTVVINGHPYVFRGSIHGQ